MENLPYELQVKILSYLPSFDLLQFCNAYEEYDYLLRDKQVIKHLSFAKAFGLQNENLPKFIFRNVAYNRIKTLNINGIYWIPALDLRNCIKYLSNLETLFAIDTRLGVGVSDCEAYFLTKVTELAICLEVNDLTYDSIKIFPPVKVLHLKILSKKIFFDELYSLFGRLKDLEDLWIYEAAEEYGIDFSRIANAIPFLSRFVIKTCRIVPFIELKYLGLHKIYEKRRFNAVSDLIFEKLDTSQVALIKSEANAIEEINELSVQDAWNVFEELHCEKPYGPQDSRRLFLGEVKLSDIYFEDLKFNHTVILCNPNFIKAGLEILGSKNCSKLKRLSLQTCFFKVVEDSQTKQPITGFKRPRSGVQVKSTTHPFKGLSENLSSLEELEVSLCDRGQGGETAAAYSSICNFAGLKKLTLDIPLFVDGSFLKDVLINCKLLVSLRITCPKQNEKFNNNLCSHIIHANRLKDLRFENYQIPIDNFFGQLSKIKECKLERIFLKCTIVAKFSVLPFKIFLEKNPQLVFLFIVINDCTKVALKDIQATLNSFKKGRPAKIFFATKDEFAFPGVYPIPSVHHDLMFCHSNVSIIDFYNYMY